MADTLFHRFIVQINRNSLESFLLNLINSIFGCIHLIFIAFLFCWHLISVIFTIDLTFNNDRTARMIAKIAINTSVTLLWLRCVYSLDSHSMSLSLPTSLLLALLQLGIVYFSTEFQSNNDNKTFTLLVAFEISLLMMLVDIQFRDDSVETLLLCSRMAPQSILNGMKAVVTHEMIFLSVVVTPSRSMNLCFEISCCLCCLSTSIWAFRNLNSSRVMMWAVVIHDVVAALRPIFTLMQTWFYYVSHRYFYDSQVSLD